MSPCLLERSVEFSLALSVLASHLCAIVTPITPQRVLRICFCNHAATSCETETKGRMLNNWKLEIVYSMCRQTGPTAVSRATLLRHT
jgi:hypothetical protein